MAPTEPTQLSTVTYSELNDIEAEFDDLNVQTLLQQVASERSLYERRAEITRRIPGFWPLVFEQAPPEIDQVVQPTDAALIVSALEDVEVVRFEVADGKGEPRSFAIRFTFGENDVFEDKVLEKKFWYRTAPAKNDKDGKPVADNNGDGTWSGLVSEPVAIKWKEGADPTHGLLDLAVKVFAEGPIDTNPEAEPTAAQQELADLLTKTSTGGLSFFAWFGWVGQRVSAEESKAAVEQQRAARAERAAKRAKGEKVGDEIDAEMEDDDEKKDDDKEDEKEVEIDDDDDEYAYDIFPDGDTIALAVAEDLYPNALKYFRQAQEHETLSDVDFEDFEGMMDEDDDEEEDEDEEDAPPAKKQKN